MHIEYTQFLNNKDGELSRHRGGELIKIYPLIRKGIVFRRYQAILWFCKDYGWLFACKEISRFRRG